MIKPEWPMRPIGDLFEVVAGKMMNAASRGAGVRTKFLRTSNVFWDEIDVGTVDDMVIAPDTLEDKLLAVGDLLVCEGGEIGRAAVWNGELDVMSFQNHLHRLRPRIAGLEPRFYVFFLQSAFTQLGIFEGAGNKTTIPNLSRGRLERLEVPVPPLDEQRAVVASLSHLRASLGVTERARSLAIELKRAAMGALFTRGLRDEAKRESELGPVPESWEVATLGSVREWLQYGTSVRCGYEPIGTPVLRIPNIEPGRVNASDLKYGIHSVEEAERFRLEKGDLLFIRTNGVVERLGACAVFEGEPTGALFASYLIRARLNRERVHPKFIAHFFGSEAGTALMAERATPAADGKYNLNTGTIDSLLVPLPPTLHEQREIAAILDGLDRKIDLHRRKRAVLDDLFKSLLHKLMTGEIRVADLNLEALDTDHLADASKMIPAEGA